MTFDQFLSLLPKIHKLPLPGRPSHFKMAPLERVKTITQDEIEAKSPKQAAVMALCYPNAEGIMMLVLILRTTYKGVHSNQIGLPGGRVEPTDISLLHTALRETEEEIGVPVGLINVVKKMTSLYVIPSNFRVQCFLGYLKRTPKFKIQEREVQNLVIVPLATLLAPKTVKMRTVTTPYLKNKKVPAFILNDQVVWGATAMMLSELKDILLKG